MGAKLNSLEHGLDKDRFDNHCKHLAIIEKSTDKLVATTRLLFCSDLKKTGNFYSETEFEISNNLNGSIMEVGRTCIHKNFRRGVVLTKLWHGIALIMSLTKANYLIGCASIPLNSGELYFNSLMHYIHSNHYSDSKYSINPSMYLGWTLLL